METQARKRERADSSNEADEPARAHPRKSRVRENIESLGTAVVLFLIVRTFLVQAFRIPSESMEDTLLKGDFLFVNKLFYGPAVPLIGGRLPSFKSLERGDVVVFKSPTDGRDYIKRCVAVAGDTIAVRDNILHVNGEVPDEEYVKMEGRASPQARSWPLDASYYVVPSGHFFAMGDNRNNSSDSRFFADRGAAESAVPEDLIVGKAMFIYCSLDPARRYLPRFSRMFRSVR